MWLQLGASLAAILALGGIAVWLKLGSDDGIGDAAAAIATAEADIAGFTGIRATIDVEGHAALVEGEDGSVVVLKRAGARLASRHLPGSAVRRDRDALHIATGDRWFGDVVITPTGALADTHVS
ncbi:hypothetical protein [Sphingomonas baiyangensis]|uniref:Uncharacterized protein n=1 Tax=Sphingomonas baiyangensis TaxID=2572576 RepID=A0A4U1L583_9SPHN|nr:hypothetical protein [Sphingomonas baiyangensis]TKD51962.1 hypothetical protein FBR43_15335 [Sphingomonas baiyangensis]